MEALGDTIENLKEELKACNEANLKLIDQAAKDKEMNIILTNEVIALRKQLVELTSVFKTQQTKVLPDDSLTKEEGSNVFLASTSEEEEASGAEAAGNMETEEKVSEKDEEEVPQSTKRKRKRRSRRKSTILSSSEEESAPVKKVSTNKVKVTQDTSKAGKSNLITRQTADNANDEFPPLPTSTPNSLSAPVTPVAENKIVPRPVKVKAIPPIVITNAGKFTSIANLFKDNNIRYSSAVVVRNGVKVFPCTVDDYRNATRLLEQNKEPFYTFRFQEEKPNHVVLRGVPSHLTKEEIMEDLKHQGFNPKKVIRWSHTNGKPMPLVLILLPKAEKDIFKVKIVCTFEVRVEAQKAKTRGIQCYNCQDRGHAAPCCHVPAKCVKCGGDHHTSKCTKPREEPAKCANCAGDHPASYSGCLHHPAQFVAKKQSTFKGWGTQDNSRLAANVQTQASKPALGETLLSKAQLEQISQLFAEQLRTIVTQLQTNRQA